MGVFKSYGSYGTYGSGLIGLIGHMGLIGLMSLIGLMGLILYIMCHGMEIVRPSCAARVLGKTAFASDRNSDSSL